jgi:hypothetical protein
MAHQRDAAQLLPFDEIGDVARVGRQIDRGRGEMAALAEAGQRRREHLVTEGAQSLSHVTPAPAAVKRAVHQNEGRHRWDSIWSRRADDAG